jgi:hypothetical protein
MSLKLRTPLFLAAAISFREVTRENEVTPNYRHGGELLGGGSANGWSCHKATPTRTALSSGASSAANEQWKINRVGV